MSRTSPSRQSSFSYIGTTSRRTSIASNPDVFSDDYALEPVDSTLDLNLQESAHSDQTLVHNDQGRDTLNVNSYPAIPHRLSGLNRPTSILKRPAAPETGFDANDAAPSRTMSTSSRFSFVRSQSPYSGPTQPSHPYAMYPQITRASSVASESTIRPHENPFIPTRGPEHPYSLYQQNTVPEDDDDDDIGSQPIPLGFPRMGLGRHAGGGASGSDVGDIIGSDGHIESLPPYTRYADNIIAKGDMANISDASTLANSRRASQRSIARTSLVPSERMEVREPSEREVLLDEEKRKESLKDKFHKKVCGGITLWLLIFIIALILFAGVVGGVIGGIVGRRQGMESAPTATVWQDTDPASTNKDTPACPTGRYTIPFKQIQEINNCVVNSAYSKSWGCLDYSFLGITISEYFNSGNKTLQVRFDDYSVDTTTFRYGPQPPDFNGTAFDLHPFKDKDNTQLGVAMFFYQMFDKLTILPGWAIKPNMKREVDAAQVLQRRGDIDGVPLQVGEQPWFCFWNSTINEFWIFLQQPITTTSWTMSSSITAATNASQQSGSVKTQFSGSSMWSNMQASATSTPTPTVTKRDIYTTPYYPQYPQLVKMIEKRKPYGNVQPYCQRMVVLPDWNIVPRPDNQIVFIKESQYGSHPISVGQRKRDTITQELESNCVCEWMST